jgi:predicted Fe-Mo cluster-binding NifX family protein
MRIAIAAVESSFESKVSGLFARCPYFIIHDTDSGSTEFLPNPNRDMKEDAGKATVEMLHARKINKIISGDFGLKVKSMLDSLHIQMIVVKKEDLSAGKIIEMVSHNSK